MVISTNLHIFFNPQIPNINKFFLVFPSSSNISTKLTHTTIMMGEGKSSKEFHPCPNHITSYFITSLLIFLKLHSNKVTRQCYFHILKLTKSNGFTIQVTKVTKQQKIPSPTTSNQNISKYHVQIYQSQINLPINN